MAVKVLGKDGGGSNSGVLKGLQFVMDDVTSKRIGGKAVMNMSLGGSLSQAVNRAIQALATAGVTPVVAAGNENASLILCSNTPDLFLPYTNTPTARCRQHFSRLGPRCHHRRCY